MTARIVLVRQGWRGWCNAGGVPGRGSRSIGLDLGSQAPGGGAVPVNEEPALFDAARALQLPLDIATLALASARGQLRWLRASARDQSRRAMDAILGPAPVADTLAREHLRHHAVREVFIRRPHMVRRMPVDGVEHLQQACATGRGVLVSYCHLGPFPGLGVTIAEHADRVHHVALAWLANPMPDLTQPVRWTRWRSMFTRAGVPLLAAQGCFPKVLDLLSHGAVVVMAFDWPGSADTMFLGRPVALASGTARLSTMSGALVVPVMREVRRGRPWTVFAPHIDPMQHVGWRPVHDAVAARHESWILERPAALEDPRRTGAWESSASSVRWGNPDTGKAQRMA